VSVAVDRGSAERHPHSSFDRVVDALERTTGPGQHSGGWVKFHCPVPSHGGGGGDRTPSLGVSYDTANSRTRVKCFSGCDDTYVLAAAGLAVADLFDEPLPAGTKNKRGGSSNGLVDLGTAGRQAPERLRAKPPAPAKTPKAPKVELGEVVAQYEYSAADGSPIGRVLRYDPKDFRPQRWNPQTKRYKFGGFPPTLYGLPQVTAAIGAGEPVYLVEGEKDADTANRYGMVGTTNASGGGRGKFLKEHAEQLRGAHVVIVADRDKAGYEHAAEAWERLDGIAASTRVVQPTHGKDLTDHAEAGQDIEDLEPIDPTAKLAELAAAAPQDAPPPVTFSGGGFGGSPPTGGSRGGSKNGDEVPNLLPLYIYRHGETVKAGGRPTDPSFTTIWRCEVVVLDQMIDDDGDPETANHGSGWQLRLRRPLSNLDGSPERDEGGEICWEEIETELAPDKVRDGSWHEDLPWPGLIHDLSNRGRTTALQAAMLVKPMPMKRGRRYTATGWREVDGQSVFVHAGGGIGKDGAVALPHVAISGKLGVFEMSTPTQDQPTLRQAAKDGLVPLVHLPGQIVAPLIGFAFRAIFGTPRTSLHMVGDPGSGKTSIARCAAMHWFAPSMQENGRSPRKEVFSALEGTGESIKGLLNKMHEAADIPITVDDFKGPKGPTKLADLQSAIWNGGGRTLATRIAGASTTTGAPRCGVITTGETASTGSSATRALTIRVGSSSLLPEGGELFDLFGPLEGKVSREARGLLGSSFIQWVAAHRERLVDWIDELEQESPYIQQWNRICSGLEHEPGVRGRLARTAMVCTSGWLALLTWLLETNVLTEPEATQIWDWALIGLIDQVREQDPSSVDGPRHMLDLLRSALLSGNCHLSNQQGGVPEDVDAATSQDGGVPYGWTPRQSVTGPIAASSFTRDEIIWQARGDRVGILTDAEVWLIPRTVLGVVSGIANRAGETFPHTSVSLGAAMAGRGWISANGAGDRSANRRIAAVQQRVWVMPRHVLDGLDEDPQNSGPTGLDVPPPPWVHQDADGLDVERKDPDLTETETMTDPVDLRPDIDHEQLADEASPEAFESPEAFDEKQLSEPELPLDDEQIPAPDPAPALVTVDVRSVARQGTDQRWLAAAAVVTADELVLPDGTHVHLGQQIAHLGDLAALASELKLGHGGGKFVLPSPGQLLLTAEGMGRFGITLDVDNPAELDANEAASAAERAGRTAAVTAVNAGWSLSRDNELRVWTRVWRPRTDDRPSITVQIVLVPLMGAFDDSRSLIADDPAPEVLARRAQLVAENLSVTWGASGGVTGLTLLRQLRPPRAMSTRAPLAATEYVAPPPPMLRDPGRVPNTAILWCRRPDRDEASRSFIHAYDANAMYLAAQGATEVGVGEAEHHKEGAAFNPKIAGLWRIDPGSSDDWRLPDITRPAGQLAGTTGWYSTPVVRYLAEELGRPPEILEAYTWDGSTRRYFDQWYQVVRDARAAMMVAAAAGDPDAKTVLDAVKQVYKRTVGRLARTEDGNVKSPLYRPDWRLAIVSTANVNLLRKLRKAGLQNDMWPVAISTDEVFYLSDQAEPTLAIPAPLKLGDGLGQFKVTRSAPLTEDITKALTGGRLAALVPLVPKVDPTQDGDR